MKGLAPSAATRADLSGSSRGSPADALGDLRVTVRASPPGTPPRTSYSSRSEHPVRFPGDFAGPSHGAPSISFGAPSVDRMSIAASGDGFTSSEDEGAGGLPPSGVVATAAPDPELTAMLARAAVSIGLEVNRPPSPEPSRLDDWFLGAGRDSQPRPAPVPFFPEVHEELTSSVSYINRLGGIRSHRMSQLARHLLLWSHMQFKSLRAVHIPGQLNRAADALSRQLTFPGEWRLHPETIRLIWSRFGEAQVDLFASPESSHCQLYFSLTDWRTGTQLASGLTQVCVSPSEPTRTDTVQAQGGRGAGPAGCAPLAHPDLVSRTHFPRDSTSLAHSSEEGPPFSGARHHMAPASRSMEPPCVAPGRDAADLSGLPPAVVETIIQARAPSTRQTYALKWSLFATWCSSQREDPRICTIGVVLSFLQERLERRLSPSTLKVYVAAIAAHHDAVDGRSLGKHDLIVRFLKGARRMNPSRPPLVPSWDLSIVLAGLQRGPFEPLDSVELKFLSLKTALLTALTSIKRVGDLQAFSVSEECLVFGPVYSHVVLRPRPGYVPKVPTTPFRDQVVNLQALPSEEADPALALLCPVRALRIYVTRTRSVRSSEQLFVCHGGQQKGKAVSKQRLAHWIVEAVALAYQSQGEPCPLGVRAHSTRSVASSHALAHGASLADICRAAG